MAKRKKVPKTPEEALRDLIPAISYAEGTGPWDTGEWGRKCLVDMGIYLRSQGIEIKSYKELVEEARS